jgi:periplasmic divalent cation tolerance protein
MTDKRRIVEMMVVLVLTTVPGVDVGETIARALVEERLAACVSIGTPITSTYRWQGTVERAVEHQLLIKTDRAQLTAVQARIGELHPYELPEMLVLEAGGSAEYLAWITAQTAAPGSEGTR